MRYLLTTLICITLVAGCRKSWTPPQNPNPETILNEARADAKNGNYADALAKHIWFFQNSLKYDPALAGVRLSFALQDWLDLSAKYPPALEKLKTIRDQAGENARNETGRESFESFFDFEAINEALKEEDKTKELFIWLDANKSNTAKDVFDVAEPALIKSKEYRLCGKYIDADSSFQKALQNYQTTIKIAAKNPKLGNFGDKKFENETTTLIALLVVNDRKNEAQQVIDKISKEPDLPEFKAEIEKALTGEVPPPWP